VTARLPGTRLHGLLRRLLSPTVVDDVLEPAVADLQYEAEQARTTGERRQVIVRGHFAILRAVVLSIEPGAIRATLALSALCGLGALLVTMARTAHTDGRLLNSAILAPGMLAPLVLRMLGTTSARRLFVGSLVAVFTPAFAGAFGMDGEATLRIRLEDAVTVVMLFAPMAAAAAIVAGEDRKTPAKRTLIAVSLGSGIATAALLLARWPQGQPLQIGLAMAPFHVALFAVLFAVTLLPLLLVARAFIARPALLALAGLVCSPAPLIAGAYIDHRTVTECLDALRRTPLSFAAWSLPFVIGAIAVGWRLPPCGVLRNSSLLRS